MRNKEKNNLHFLIFLSYNTDSSTHIGDAECKLSPGVQGPLLFVGLHTVHVYFARVASRDNELVIRGEANGPNVGWACLHNSHLFPRLSVPQAQ